MKRASSNSETPAAIPKVAKVCRSAYGERHPGRANPPGGGARIFQQVWIQKIEMAGANDGTPLSVKWAVSPL